MSRFDRSSHMMTDYIRINNRKCEACWDCVNACPKKVIGKVNFFFHKHTHIDYPNECIGCFKCVKACKHEAISKILKDS